MTIKKEHEPYRDKNQIYSEILTIVKDGESTGGLTRQS